jgi:hypothetical protein
MRSYVCLLTAAADFGYVLHFGGLGNNFKNCGLTRTMSFE